MAVPDSFHFHMMDLVLCEMFKAWDLTSALYIYSEVTLISVRVVGELEHIPVIPEAGKLNSFQLQGTYHSVTPIGNLLSLTGLIYISLDCERTKLECLEKIHAEMRKTHGKIQIQGGVAES